MGSELIGRPGDLAHIVSQALDGHEPRSLPNPHEDKACLIGLLHLLETIEKRNPDTELRGKAGLHAQSLRAMLKRHRHEGRVTITDMDAYGPEKPKLIGGPRALPAAVEVLEIEAKEIK
jgi:hypothetical protein